MNKKAQDFSLEEIIFIVVNILFFVTLLVFVRSASSGAFVNEQFYAKQIALLIDSSNPGTKISVDVSDAYSLAKSNNMDLSQIIKFENNQVIVTLSGSRIYAYNYFNNVNVEAKYREENSKVFLDIFLTKNTQ